MTFRWKAERVGQERSEQKEDMQRSGGRKAFGVLDKLKASLCIRSLRTGGAVGTDRLARKGRQESPSQSLPQAVTFHNKLSD